LAELIHPFPPDGGEPRSSLGKKTAIVVIDIQQGGAAPIAESGIAVMDGYAEMAGRAEVLVGAARAAGLPVIFVQELHRPDGVDFGRELDGDEGIHCIEGAAATELWPTLRPGPGDYYVPKRRYSAFFGTDLEILLRGLGSETLVLIGSLTDVCIHYTFADAHQRDFRTRVVEDCVIGSSTAAHEASLAAMEYLQHGARCTTEKLLVELRLLVELQNRLPVGVLAPSQTGVLG
jgi:nicotinamidase-related amidase